MPNTVSNFKTKRGTSLETLWWARASSCDEGDTTWFFSSCEGIVDLRWGIQASSCVGPGKSILPFDGVPLEGTRRVGGLLGVAGRLSGTVSPFIDVWQFLTMLTEYILILF